MEAILKQFQQFLKEYEEGFINDKECYDKIHKQFIGNNK